MASHRGVLKRQVSVHSLKLGVLCLKLANALPYHLYLSVRAVGSVWNRNIPGSVFRLIFRHVIKIVRLVYYISDSVYIEAAPVKDEAAAGAAASDAGRIADEVISHLAGLVGAELRVTLEIQATLPSGAPEHVVRAVTENGRTLKFTSQDFEKE